MKNNFLDLGGGDIISGDFIKMKESRTVVVQHMDGRISEHLGITDPWKYIAKIKKAVDVKNAWIK